MKRTNKDRKTRLAVGSLVGLAILLVWAFAVIGQSEGHAADAALEGYDPFVVAAGVLGLSEDELDAQLDDGASLAQIARDRSIDPDAIVRAIVEAEAAAVNQALADEEIDGTEAAEWRDVGYAFAVEFVYLPLDELWLDEFGEFDDCEFFGFDGEHGDFGEFDDSELFVGFGDLEGIDIFEFEAFGLFPYGMAVESQRDMAYSLLDNGAEPETVVDAVLDAEASLLEQVLGLVFGLFDFDLWGEDEYGEAWEDELIEIASEALGLDEDAIWDALDSGGTIAELASANGVDPQAIIDAMMVEEEELIAELLSDGELTEEEAVEWRQESLEMIQEIVREPWF